MDEVGCPCPCLLRVWTVHSIGSYTLSGARVQRGREVARSEPPHGRRHARHVGTIEATYRRVRCVRSTFDAGYA